jgi:tetratricopeptide (TPR) repeat protein
MTNAHRWDWGQVIPWIVVIVTGLAVATWRPTRWATGDEPRDSTNWRAVDVTSRRESRAANVEPSETEPDASASAVTPSTDLEVAEPVPPDLGEEADVSKAPPESNQNEPNAAQLAPALFHGIEVGKSSLAEVEQSFGSSEVTLEETGHQTRRYQVLPFEAVEVTFADDIVQGIVVHLGRLLRVDTMAEQLSLELATSVVVRDTEGQPVGQAFPEKGVLLHFAPGRSGRFVAHVLLDPISTEAFLLRAEEVRRERPQAALDDLRIAAELDPTSAAPFALKSKTLLELDLAGEAVVAADEAVRLDGDNVDYRLLQVRARMEAGDRVEAESLLAKLSDAVIDADSLSAAELEQLRGDLHSAGPSQDLEKAIVLHQRAIALAEPHAVSPNWEIRRRAKELLLEAHLAVAADIAWGRYRGKADVLPKWIARSKEIATNLVEREGLPELNRIRVSRTALACAVAVPGELESESALNDALRVALGHLDQTHGDRLLDAHLHWILGTMLHDAMLVAHGAGRADQAISFGEAAVKQLEQSASLRTEPHAAGIDFQLGETQFRLGAVYAIHRKDHLRASEYYEMSLDYLDRVPPEHDVPEMASWGEMYISMGVSYWARDNQKKAVELTVRGIELLERAVGDGRVKEAELALPYANLAAMHRDMGDEKSSRLFAEMASEVRANRR